MKKDTRHFFLASIICAVFCIGIFFWSTSSMIRQWRDADNMLGEIYMNAMNFQMQLHFRSIIELRLKQLEAIVSRTPPEKETEYSEATRRELRTSAVLREFSYLALYSTDGHAEVITGEPLSINDEAAFLHALNKGEKSVVSALTSSGKKYIILGISVGYPVSRGYPMKDGRICTALVVGQPLESISDAMSLNLDESQVYSQIIRKDGSFVFRNAAVEEGNYYTWFAKNARFEGKTTEEMLKNLQDSIRRRSNYTMFLTVNGERHHMH